MSEFKNKKLEWQIKNTELLIEKAMLDIAEFEATQYDRIAQFEKQLKELKDQRGDK